MQKQFTFDQGTVQNFCHLHAYPFWETTFNQTNFNKNGSQKFFLEFHCVIIINIYPKVLW